MEKRIKQKKRGLGSMILVLLITGILQSLGDPTAISLWGWFDHHILLTIGLVLVLG